MRRYPPFDGELQLPEVRLPAPPRGFWLWVVLVAIALVILFVATPLITFYTELQWFQALGLRNVYTTRLGLQFSLFFGSLLVAFVFATANVAVALQLRAASALRTIGIRRRILRTRAGVIGLAVSALVALAVSLGAGAQWQQLALYLNGTTTGVQEPVFGQDVAFYLFVLPFWHSILNWLLGLTFLTTLLVAALYAWRGTDFELRLPDRGVAHVSVLLALVALVLGAGSFIGRYDLLYAHNGYVWGAGFTDINARIPIAYISTALAVVLALALVANAVVRRLWLPVVALAVWIVFGILGGLYGVAIQRFAVAPNEYNQEKQYIARELDMTRKAFGLDNVRTSDYPGSTRLTAQDVANDRTTIDNLRLWDYQQLQEIYPQIQAIRTYYDFSDIDLDRYVIDGRYLQLEISARELRTDRLPSQAGGFVNQKLTYTHGYGVSASPVNTVVGDGLPDLVAKNIPPQGQLAVTQPDIYFGETTSPFVLAPTAQKEFDYPGSPDVYTHYTGTHSPKLDGVNRWLWAARTGDLNLLITSQVQPSTEILYHRNIVDRVRNIAPFLDYDRDPYIVVVDGRLYWIVDAYTSATTYPYSQTESASNFLSGSTLGDVNYIRNSVKVVIDPYEGTTTFYVADPNDALIKAYRKTFPSLFTPISEMPAGLRSHIRYPEDIFSIQSAVFTAYHIRDTQVFYNREDVWATPAEQRGPTASATTLQPYYVMMRLRDTGTVEYLLILPFTPNNRPNMIAWLAARNDAPNYGQLVLYSLPHTVNIYGPQQVASLIQANSQISSQFSLWNQGGSQVQQGNLLVVPVGGSFLYFEPVYLRATSSSTSFPQFRKVILADSEKVVWDDTLQGALSQLVGTGVAPTPPAGGPPAAAGSCLQQLSQQANQHYQAAQDRLKAGDLAGYANEMNQVGQLLQQMQTASATSPCSASTTPGSSPKPSP